MSDFRVLCRNGSGEATLSLVGEIDLATAWKLERAVESALTHPSRRLVLDLRRVHFMDAAGARVLMHAELHARQTGCKLVVVQGPPAVQRVLDLTGLSERLPIVRRPPVVAA